jgi:hypothetical protein
MPRPRPTPPSTPPAPSPPVHPGDAGAGRPPGMDALYFTVTALLTASPLMALAATVVARAAAAVTPCRMVARPDDSRGAGAGFRRTVGTRLVGKKYDADGKLVDNPNAKWAISNTARDVTREIMPR